MTRTKLADRQLPDYTKGEEITNMVSHIVGAVFGIVALVLCVVVSAIHGNAYGVVSSTIYGVTMIMLYTMSSIYHGLKPERKGKNHESTLPNRIITDKTCCKDPPVAGCRCTDACTVDQLRGSLRDFRCFSPSWKRFHRNCNNELCIRDRFNF